MPLNQLNSILTDPEMDAPYMRNDHGQPKIISEGKTLSSTKITDATTIHTMKNTEDQE